MIANIVRVVVVEMRTPTRTHNPPPHPSQVGLCCYETHKILRTVPYKEQNVTTKSLLCFLLVAMLFWCCVHNKNNVSDLKKAIRRRRWKKISRLVKNFPTAVVQDQLAEDEFDILWNDAPLETIRAVLRAWPEAYEMEDGNELNLLEAKVHKQQWDYLDVIFQEVPQVRETYPAGEYAAQGAPLNFLEKHWKEAGALLYSIHNKDWEKFGEILQEYPHLAKEGLSEDTFDILWNDAPLEIIKVLLEVWPEAYEMEDGIEQDLVKAKVYKQQWDYLDVIFQAVPQVRETYPAGEYAAQGAPLNFLEKHWKEAGSLFHSIHNGGWEKFGEILKEYPQLAKEGLSEDEFGNLWHDAPLKIIRSLLQVRPKVYRHGGKCKDRKYRDLVEVKSIQEQWDFLGEIFQEFPQVLEMKYASVAAKYGASFEFLDKHWKEAGALLHSIHNKDWEKIGEILKDNPQLAKYQLSEDEFTILWKEGPVEIIEALLEAWPDAHEMNDGNWSNLVEGKIERGQWEFLKSLIRSFPNLITAEDVRYACQKDAPLDIFELMLKQQPNAPLEEPDITFHLIVKNKVEHFCAVLDQHPTVTELKDEGLHLTPLLIMLQEKEQINTDWIGPILRANRDAAKQKDFDGKTALHLAYQQGASSEIINMIQQAYPGAGNERDNLGRFPKDLANQLKKDVFTPANETLIHGDNLNAEKKNLYSDDAVVVCRGDMLIRDLQATQSEEYGLMYWNYFKQSLVRHRIFGTLLDEFSNMVGVDDKDVVQKAAAIQALASKHLSHQDGTIINFGAFENPGYWYQQEVLKLVMRVYHEGQSELEKTYPSLIDDAAVCMKHLEYKENGKPSPEPSEKHVNAYNELAKWLAEGLDSSFYSLQGPVLKPLQSLFNKLFIRRGQTVTSVIGDMVRGTLLLDNKTMLKEIVKRIKNTFPNITKNQFRHPDKFDRLTDFVTYVHDDLDLLPDSHVLPYRFKANSSQKKEEPLWYNLNFFLQVPEYHRVGFSEMFVACELQIGVEAEINKHRQSHVAYERDRILSNQPLLKNYDTMRKEEDEDAFSRMSNCTEDDNKLIEKILFGKIASEVLIPCTTTTVAGNNNKTNFLLFENGPFSLSKDDIEAGSYVKPERLCLNNRSLNWFSLDCPKKDKFGNICMAFRAAGPYKLDSTKRYFVDSFVLTNRDFEGFHGTVGLYAHVGPYLVQVTCEGLTEKADDVVMVKSCQNFKYLEQACPIPAGTTALEVITYGSVDRDVRFGYDSMKLLLKVFNVFNVY